MRPGHGLTVRARILITVLVLTGIALLAAGGSAYLLQRDRVDDAIDASLRRTEQEFRSFAAVAVDPATGEPFTTPYSLILAGMAREVPADNEGMIGFVDDVLELEISGGARLAEDDVLVEHLTARVSAGDGVIASTTTPTAQYRYALIPVEVPGVGDGALVVGFDRSAEMSGAEDTFRTYALVAAGSFALLAVVAWVLAGRLLRPLRELRETAEVISETDLSRRIDVRGTDDISELARTVNAMLARLELSFGSQRRLLDDAGHELRTPITIVRGHLELMDPTDPDDAAATRELALSELDRMHRLADDLVMLAKMDQPHVVRWAPTSIGRLTDEALDRARALGERRWLVDRRLEATVGVDAQRIMQAWLQLASNAVRFSAEGSTVALGSDLRGGRLLLWVRDEGVGIQPEDRERIFDRFARAGDGAHEGAGLGLAIVAGIAQAHGGRVRVDSLPGAGSTFVLDLPARDVEEDDRPTTELPVVG